jgi:hypothetical protein
VIVLRYRDPQTPRPYRVGFFLLPTVAFCGVCVFLVYGAIDYKPFLSAVAIGLTLAGLPMYWLTSYGEEQPRKKGSLRWGEVGLICVIIGAAPPLVSLFASALSGQLSWFVGIIARLALSFGSAVCIIALFKRSGRVAAVYGILLSIAIGILSLALR